MADTETEQKEDTTAESVSNQGIPQSTTNNAAFPPQPKFQGAVSSSTSNLLSAEYNPSHNPKKDELVQNTSIRILEVDNLLDKLNHHIDKHHRKSSKKLQDFEQIHSELSKIQCTLIQDEQDMNHSSNQRMQSQIDPFIVIAATDDDDDKYSDEKDDEKHDKRIHQSKLSQLEPFQSLVSKIQHQHEPNAPTSSDSDMEQKQTQKRRSSIKVKQSELTTIHDYVNQHRHKMKEKTIQYEEKKKQLLSAKERLNKAKQRFRKRLNKSKNRNRNRTRSEHTKIRNMRYHKHKHQHPPTSVSQTSSPVVKIIKENADADDQPTLSLANLSKLNSNTASELSSLGNKQKHSNYFMRSGPMSPQSKVLQGLGLYTAQHHKSHTGSSVQSSFSVISDQSFVEDFHSINAELESIDDIVRTQVKSPSMTSIFSDLGSPKDGQVSSSTKFNYSEQHIKNNTSSMSADSESNPKRYQSYASSTDNSLQSELCQLQDIENQIGGL